MKINKEVIYLVIAIIAIPLIVVVASNINNSQNNTITGEAIARYYGVSNYPLNLNSACGNSFCKKGVQTLVTISKSELNGLSSGGTVIDVSSKIVSAINLGNTIVSIYQEGLKAVVGAAIPIPTSGLDIVTAASAKTIDEFKKNTQCLSQVGSKLPSLSSPDKNGNYQFAVVSYMMYKQCANYPAWLYAFVRHDYYTTSGKYICTYEGAKLFSLEMGTGKIKSSTFGC